MGSEGWDGELATLLVLALIVLPASKSSPALIYHKALSKMGNVSQHALSLTEDEQLLPPLVLEGSLLWFLFPLLFLLATSDL